MSADSRIGELAVNRVKLVIYTFLMVGFVHLLVMVTRAEVANYMSDLTTSNSYEQIHNDVGLLHNFYNFMETGNDPQNPQLHQSNLNKTLSYIETQLEAQKSLVPSMSNLTHPLRIVIVSSWRAGSNLLTEILSSYMAAYQHHESLQPEGIQDRMKNQLQCKNLTTNQLYPWYMKTTNPLIWKGCWKTAFANKKQAIKLCSNTTVLDKSCSLFPMQLMQLQHSRLSTTRSLLQDPQLNGTKIVLVVRDPRATITSRLSVGAIRWSHQQIDHNNSMKLCDNMNSDLDEYIQLSRLYPHRIFIIKYEWLIGAPQATIELLFNFLDLPITDAVKQKVVSLGTRDPITYTPTPSDRQMMVGRANRRFGVLNTTEIDRIERDCVALLQRLGYPLSEARAKSVKKMF